MQTTTRTSSSSSTTPKLAVELVPASMWGANLRAILNKKTWDIVRRNCYAAAGHKCEICKKTGAKSRVDCHEIWEFDDVHSVQRLAGLICLCPTCHAVKHMGHTLNLGGAILEAAYKKLCTVNGWTEQQASEHIYLAFAEFEERSKREWKLDVSWLGENKHFLERGEEDGRTRS